MKDDTTTSAGHTASPEGNGPTVSDVFTYGAGLMIITAGTVVLTYQFLVGLTGGMSDYRTNILLILGLIAAGHAIMLSTGKFGWKWGTRCILAFFLAVWMMFLYLALYLPEKESSSEWTGDTGPYGIDPWASVDFAFFSDVIWYTFAIAIGYAVAITFVIFARYMGAHPMA